MKSIIERGAIFEKNHHEHLKKKHNEARFARLTTRLDKPSVTDACVNFTIRPIVFV